MIESSIPYMQGIEGLERLGDIMFLPNNELSAERIQDCDALIVRSITKCDEAVLKDSQVKYIATATAGFDHIDVDYCTKSGIEWTTAIGCNARAVAQYVCSALSSLSLWDDWSFSDKVIGIIGVGHVGRELEQMARALGMKALLYDPLRAEVEGIEAFVSLEQIQEEADIISLHVPLTKTGAYPTYRMIDWNFLNACQRKPILVNACRGAVTPSEDLLRAKAEHKISRLVLDCWENEPRISWELSQIADLISPHIAGFSAEGKLRGGRMCLQALADFWGVGLKGLMDTSVLAEPKEACIRLDESEPHFLARCLLHTLDLEPLSKTLQASPERFEELRKAYVYPREMSAYQVLINSNQYQKQLEALGFECIQNRKE